MAERAQTQVKPTVVPVLPAGGSLLQRKCACGTHTLGGQCDSCKGKGGMLQRKASTSAGVSQVPPIVHEVLNSPGQSLDLHTRDVMQSRFGHDFSRVRANSRSHSSNGLEDDESLESVNIPMPRSTSLPPRTPVPTPGLPRRAPTRPTGTSVDTTTDLTLAGLGAGFLSAYGIIARMRVLPEATNWDGKQIPEVLSQTSSTCPPGLTRPGPCAGDSTFTVGAQSGGSNVIPVQPAMQNRFYDFHTTRSRTISFLHDPTRNPAGLNSCETVCQQTYSCDGVPIGTHRITRRFIKSTFNSRDVTIVNITKEDPVLGPGDFPQRTLPSGDEYA
jgi:hypothetical protein